MSLELPILRIAHAGFTLDQQAWLREALAGDRSTGLLWEEVDLGEADALILNGARTQQLEDGTVRVAAGVPGQRSVQIAVQDTQRPLAYARPLAPRHWSPALQFDVGRFESLAAVLHAFAEQLHHQAALFCLASQVLEQEELLGADAYEVWSGDAQVAVIDLRGDAAVLPSATPQEFADAVWFGRTRAQLTVPEHLHRVSLSHLMWEYALRTRRDVLPQRYRQGPLYFRRPPRLPHRLLADVHLLLLRELAQRAGSFEDLQRRTRLGADELARGLAALYLVGAITSNARRAAQPAMRRRDGQATPSTGPSGLDAVASLLPGALDLTAPAHLPIA